MKASKSTQQLMNQGEKNQEEKCTCLYSNGNGNMAFKTHETKHNSQHYYTSRTHYSGKKHDSNPIPNSYQEKFLGINFTQEMKDDYNKNYITLMKETEGKELEMHPMFVDWEKKHPLTALTTQDGLQFSAIPVKTPMAFRRLGKKKKNYQNLCRAMRS